MSRSSHVPCRPLEPRTVVIVPGLTMDQDVLAKVLGGLHNEDRQLAMLMPLRLPRTRVVFLSSTPIECTIVDYYLGLLERIRDAIGDPAIAHLSCFNVTALERTLAVRLGIPLYGCDPSLQYLDGPSGQVFQACTFPADAAYAQQIQSLAVRAGGR